MTEPQPSPVTREEWRVVGEPGEPYPPYRFTFDTEEAARGFVELALRVQRQPWRVGPYLEHRTVTETPWERE